MRHHYSTTLGRTLFQRAAGVGGASTVHSLATAAGLSAREPLERALPDDDDHKRAEYRAWREGSPVHHQRPKNHARVMVQSTQQIAQPPGSRLTGDFDMTSAELMGKGGFGLVYAATSRLDGHRYALKLLPDNGTPPAETRCMASLAPHSNLVRYCSVWSEAAAVSELRAAISARNPALLAHEDDVEEYDDTDDYEEDDDDDDHLTIAPRTAGGALVLQLELMSTPTLHDILRREMHASSPPDASSGGHAPCPVRWAWIAGVASGLEHMHRGGWCHNDVKPANIFCGADGSATLGDMGLASAWPATAQTVGQPLAAGTPLYLAPERRRVLLCPDGSQGESDGTPSPAGDIYSLGVVTAEVFGAFTTVMERAAVIDGLKREAAASAGGSSCGATETRRRRLPNADAEELAVEMLTVRPSARPIPATVVRRARVHGSVQP